MTTETKLMPVQNPFNDSVENLLCEFDLHFVKGKLVQACISSIMSNSDINLMGWLKTERVEEIEDKFVGDYNG